MRTPEAIWEKANCRNADTEIFYPDRDGETYNKVATLAKLYCFGDPDDRHYRDPCPVLAECLFYGLVTEDNFGIWGGMSPRERNALRRSGSKGMERLAVKYDSANKRYLNYIANYLEQRRGNKEVEDDD